jgi:hypothetical protein
MLTPKGIEMYTSFVLVKNLISDSNELNFSEFKLTKIQYGDIDALRRAQELFSVGVPLYGDWIYERYYNNIKADSLQIIPNDIENILLLLRLFKLGDLVFIKHCIREKGGNMLRQLPYRVMSDIRPFCKYDMQNDECFEFDIFVSEMTSYNNWDSTWFQTARRFFLYGGGKEFNPRHNEVDRIVDYMIVMESILVPERGDFIGMRLRKRAISLLKNHDIDNNKAKPLLKDFYNIRSTIVHGANVSSFKNRVLDRHNEFESIVRKVMIEAVKMLPEDDGRREKFLKGLFDVSDQNRAKEVYKDFCAIKDTNAKKGCFDLISTRMTKTENREKKKAL